MTDARLPTLVSLISPFKADRKSARELFAAGEFAEEYPEMRFDTNVRGVKNIVDSHRGFVRRGCKRARTPAPALY
jgi:adenylylsulfate kinase-like enzyme